MGKNKQKNKQKIFKFKKKILSYKLKKSIMIFVCNRCSKVFSTKQSLTRHSNRKFICLGVENKKKEKELSKKVIQSYPKLSKVIFNVKKQQNTEDFLLISNKKSANKNVCKYCSKVFAYKSGLSKHINTLVCKKIPKNEKIAILKNCNNRAVEELREFQESNNSNNYSQKINNYTNTHNNINTQNNIQTQNNINITVNPFGKENLEKITEKTMMRVLNKAFCAFPAALEEIYFKIPENRNFYLPNKSERKYISYFDGSRCVYEKKDDFNYKVKNNVMDVLENWFDICKEKFLTRRQNLITRMFKDYGRGKLDDRHDEEVERFLLTYSNDIKELVDVQVNKLRKRRTVENKLS